MYCWKPLLARFGKLRQARRVGRTDGQHVTPPASNMLCMQNSPPSSSRGIEVQTLDFKLSKVITIINMDLGSVLVPVLSITSSQGWIEESILPTLES